MARRKREKKIALSQIDPPGRSDKSFEAAECGSVRSSTRGRWRSLSLFLVHVAIALHIAHWWVTGKTITPMEPSEAMQTLGTEALLNAGFVLFALTILSTLVFGRFFCGWGCHLVAYQDLCSWMLKKVGIRPQPFRSRVLLFVPLAAAIFMFVVPTVSRWIMGWERAPLSAHFTTYDFWERFPGWVVASLTIGVCGFVIVYFLGNKGFCSYACPYGGFFGLADKFAPGKIRVTDACEQCGHCTAACSSNVRVHEEVHLYKMVINPGCMKCLDCVSVCPKGALFFGYGKSSLRAPKADARRRRYDFSWPEEFALGGFFLISVVILRKLYDGVPFLLALALGSLSAYALLSFLRFLYARQIRFARYSLRTGGKISRAGYLFCLAMLVWVAFLSHSAVVQFYSVRGRMALRAARTVTENQAAIEVRRQLDQGIADLEKADSLGLVPVANLLFDLGMGYARRGEAEEAKSVLQRAVTFAPDFAAGRYELANLMKSEGANEEAIELLFETVRVSPQFPLAHSDLANLLLAHNRGNEAIDMLNELIHDRPDVVEFHLARGLVMAHLSMTEEALNEMRNTVESWPDHPDAHYNLGATLMATGETEQALKSFEAAARINPNSALIRYSLGQSAQHVERHAFAELHFRAAKDLDPFNRPYVQAWALSVARNDKLESEIALAEQRSAQERTARFRLVFLYLAAGHNEKAQRLAEEFQH